MNRPYKRLALLTGLCLASGGLIVTAEADDVQVNTYTLGNQERPSVSLAANGDFVAVWQSYGSGDTDSYFSIQGQRFGADGSPVAGEFQVNTYTTDYQLNPAVGVDADGNFVVVWASDGSSGTDSSSYSIQIQRYASDGSPLGIELQVNTYTTNAQAGPAVGVSADGDFIVAWQSLGSGTDSSGYGVLAQRYASDGSPLGDEFQVNTYTFSNQRSPSVGVDADGDFVVAWQSVGSSGTDTSSSSVLAQRFASDGAPLGAELQVNTFTTDNQQRPSVAVAADGDFDVVWQSAGSSGTDSVAFSIQGQRFASDGSPVGVEFQVNTYTLNSQEEPSVDVDGDGDFLVSWHGVGSGGTDASIFSVQAQRYASNGSAIGDEFQVNTYTTSNQRFSSVGVDADGDFVVVWQSIGSGGTDTAGYSVQSRAGVIVIEVFVDGFESGDTTVWSATVGGSP